MSSVTWAFGSIRYARLSDAFSPYAVNFTRAAIALPLFVLSVFIYAGDFQLGFTEFAKLRMDQIGWFGISMFASYGFADSIFFMSANLLGVPGALAIASTYPVWTTFAGAIWQHENVILLQWIGLLITVCGVIIVILKSPRSSVAHATRSQKQIIHGVFLAILTSIFWAVNSFAVTHAGKGLSPLVGNSVRMVFALVLCLLLGRLMAPEKPRVLSKTALRGSGLIFIFEAFGGSLFFMYGLSNSPVILGSTLSSLAPVISVPLSWALKTEKISWIRALGVLLVVLGISLLIR